MRTILLFALLFAIGCTPIDGDYQLIAHEDMTDTLDVSVMFTIEDDIIINDGMMYFEFIGSRQYVMADRLTHYRMKRGDRFFCLIGIDNEDIFVFNEKP